jgi:HPt (histidine-containing phosphotransfer) domain-containing protein
MIIPEALRQKFLAGLVRRTDELDLLIAANDGEAIYRAFHSLAGIGGTYGYANVTALAREGEVHSRGGDVAELRRIVAELRKAA